MSNKTSIAGTTEAWESGALGKSAEFVRKASEQTANKIDEALGLQAISIRLPKAVIETYKMLAGMYGVGYQPLMRDALCRFAEGEMKQLLVAAVETQRQQRKTSRPSKPGVESPVSIKKLKKAA